MADIRPYSLAGSTERRQSIGNIYIDLSRIRLTRDGIYRFKPSLFSNDLIKLFHFRVITVEDC